MLPQDYWPKSPSLELSDAISSGISPQKLKQTVTSGLLKQDWVDSVCHTLTHGADLGFRGSRRVAFGRQEHPELHQGWLQVNNLRDMYNIWSNKASMQVHGCHCPLD